MLMHKLIDCIKRIPAVLIALIVWLILVPLHLWQAHIAFLICIIALPMFTKYHLLCRSGFYKFFLLFLKEYIASTLGILKYTILARQNKEATIRIQFDRKTPENIRNLISTAITTSPGTIVTNIEEDGTMVINTFDKSFRDGVLAFTRHAENLCHCKQ